MDNNFEIIRNVFDLKWYIIYIDDDMIIKGREIGSQKFLTGSSLKQITHTFFYSDHDGRWFTCYVWITEKFEVVYLPAVDFDPYLLARYMSKDILITLNTRQAIETYYNTFINL